MIRSYLTTALRALQRHLGYAAINVVGLAVGIAVCLLITLYLRHELSYDDFHADADRIVRVVSEWDNFSVPATNPPMVRALRTEWPDVPMARLLRTSGLVSHGDVRFEEDDIFFTDGAFFDVFAFDLVRGDPETVLTEPFTVVLTTETAQKYFPDANPVGQTIRVDNQFDVEVTGVVELAPETSHLRYDVLASWATIQTVLRIDESMEWGNNGIYTYLKVPEARSIEAMEAQLPGIITRYAGANWNGSELLLEPITRIHLYSHRNMELSRNGRAAYVWLFGVIAAFVLLLACVNFVNLATARATERAREVGVRKTMGAVRSQLVGQFLAEAFVQAAGAMVLALVLATLAMPLFRVLTGTSVHLSLYNDPAMAAAAVLITVVAALGAGGYPAFVLSGYRPANVLRGATRDGGRGGGLRKGLVVFQFATAVCLIAGTLVAWHQLTYLRTANLGYDSDHLLTVAAPGNPTQGQQQQRFAAWKEQAEAQPGVASVSVTSEPFPSELLGGTGVSVRGSGVPLDSARSLRAVAVGPDFFETIGVAAVAGRTFTPRPADTTGVVINEAAYAVLAAQMADPPRGPSDLVGRAIEMRWRGNRTGPLLGVVDDFHMATLHEPIEPMVFFYDAQRFSTYLIRVDATDVATSLASLEATWERVFPAWPFEYRFVDDAFDAHYRAEQRLGWLFGVFAGLAVVIACLGLFGLAAFTAQQRTREIGIRKAVGASVTNIVTLLSRDFAALVAVSIGVAVPVSYFALDGWLDTFAYRVDLGPGVFAGAGALALFIALATVGVQALRAAHLDPARVLQRE